MKRNLILEIIVALLILLFVYTATSKLFDFRTFKWVLGESPLVGKKIAPVAAWILPLAEIAISLLLFFPRSRRLGLWGSFLIMAIFTAYIGYMLAFRSHLPCNCGGVLKQMTWKQHLVFNIFFTLLALTGLWLSRKRPPSAVKHENMEQAVFT